MKQNRYKNITEEINRVKEIISLNEQCGPDLIQCGEDLQEKGYKVFTPKDYSTKVDKCRGNDVIKCVKELLINNNVNEDNITVADGGAQGCYVLAEGSGIMSGTGRSKWNVTFFADKYIVITAKLGKHNKNMKLVYRGEFNCNIDEIINLNYIGNFSDGRINAEAEYTLKDASGNDRTLTDAEAIELGDEDAKYVTNKNYLFYILESVMNGKPKITKIISKFLK